MERMDWASVQSEQAMRFRREVMVTPPDANPPTANPPNGHLTSGEPTDPPVTPNEDLTLEEKVFANLLSAHSDILDAFSQYDKLTAIAREAEEVRYVQERSIVETRLDRNVCLFLTSVERLL